MLLETEEGIWARADAQVFRLLMDGERTERRLQAAERTIAAAFRRVESLRKRRRAAVAAEQAAANRKLDQELARAWGRPIRIRFSRTNEQNGASCARRHKIEKLAGISRRAVRTYLAPIVDKRGRVALFFRVRYVGFKSKGWRPGLSADHALYILRDDAIEQIGAPLVDASVMSNMGKDAQEIAACWRALEAVEEAYRANAIVQHRIIWNLPHDIDAAERRALVQEFCERTFGRLGLPWAAAIHVPDAKGDARNYHAHIIFSLRPCERTGEHEWSITQEKLNGLTDPDGLKLMRALAAAHMNRACHAAGRPERFTHQTYQERGIAAERQSHVGAAAMAAHERGEHVHSIARNALIAESNELAFEQAHAAKQVEAQGKLVALLDRQMRSDAARRRVAIITGRARAVADSARNVANGLLRTQPAKRTAHRHFAILVRDRAHAVLQMLIRQRRARRPLGETKFIAAKLGVVAWQPADRIRSAPTLRVPSRQAQTIADRLMVASVAATRSSALRKKLAEQRGEALALRERLIRQNQQQTADRARQLILTAKMPPYRVEQNRLILDLSAMPNGERGVVESLPLDDLRRALRERHRQDLKYQEEQRQARETEAKRMEAERAAEAARQTLVEEACRILHQSGPRPYRRTGTRLQPDWSVLSHQERETVMEVGINDQILQAALVERAKQDDHHDRLVAMLDDVEQNRAYIAVLDNTRMPDAQLLAAYNLTDNDLRTEAVQRRLTAIAEQQREELQTIAAHIEAHPAHLVRKETGWTLTAAAPPLTRYLLEAWRHDQGVQTVLADVAARFSAATPTNPSPMIPPQNRGKEDPQPPSPVGSPDAAPQVPVEQAVPATQRVTGKLPAGVGRIARIATNADTISR